MLMEKWPKLYTKLCQGVVGVGVVGVGGRGVVGVGGGGGVGQGVGWWG